MKPCIFDGVEVSARLFHSLQNNNYETWPAVSHDWERFGPNHFLRIPFLGRKSLNELRDILNDPQAGKRPITENEYRRALAVVLAFRKQTEDETGNIENTGNHS